MKKLIIIIAIGVFLGTPSLAQQPPAVSNSQLTSDNKKAIHEMLEKIYESMTGNRDNLNDFEHNMPSDTYDPRKYFLEKPEDIYKYIHSKRRNKGVTSRISRWIDEFKEKEGYNLYKTDNFYRSMSERSKFLGIVSKAISFKAFENVEHRLNKIKELEEKIDKTKDLKEIAQLQAQIKIIFNKLQNEITQLQTIEYFNNAEHVLKKRQKRQYNIKVLGRDNRTIPEI
ncbi:type IV secretion system protein, partial [Bartonella rattimassiliensis]|uniref:type IV secretion system protein n=1 Tax=Bartonella rattimassiliensis TaxID=270250 RepID=UPI00037B6B46